MSGQQINVGDVVLVHDNCQLINWMMVVVEGFMTSSDGLACSVRIQIINGVTNHASIKRVYLLKLSKENLSTATHDGGG